MKRKTSINLALKVYKENDEWFFVEKSIPGINGDFWNNFYAMCEKIAKRFPIAGDNAILKISSAPFKGSMRVGAIDGAHAMVNVANTRISLGGAQNAILDLFVDAGYKMAYVAIVSEK